MCLITSVIFTCGFYPSPSPAPSQVFTTVDSVVFYSVGNGMFVESGASCAFCLFHLSPPGVDVWWPGADCHVLTGGSRLQKGVSVFVARRRGENTQPQHHENGGSVDGRVQSILLQNQPRLGRTFDLSVGPCRLKLLGSIAGTSFLATGCRPGAQTCCPGLQTWDTCACQLHWHDYPHQHLNVVSIWYLYSSTLQM